MKTDNVIILQQNSINRNCFAMTCARREAHYNIFRESIFYDRMFAI